MCFGSGGALTITTKCAVYKMTRSTLVQSGADS